MLDKLIGFALGYLFCKGIGVLEHPGSILPDWLHVTTTSTPPSIPQGARPILTSTSATFPSSSPKGLPPWPSGWRAMTKVPNSVTQRAWALLSVLKLGERKQELGPSGGWLTYYKTKLGNGKTGVTVFEPKPTSSPSGTESRAFS